MSDTTGRTATMAMTRGLTAWLVALVAFLIAGSLAAAPKAHLLRIDPRSSVEDNAPVLTTVVELLQHKSISDLTSQCAEQTGNAGLACLAGKLEQPRALYEPFKLPEKNTIFTVNVDGRDQMAELASVARWGKSKNTKGVGTAWLLIIDASGQMGSRFPEAKRVAKAFIDEMGPNDIVDVMFFNDRSIVRHSKWKAKKGLATNFIDSVQSTFPKQGRTKTLFSIVTKGVNDAFQELGNVGAGMDVPLHQAMVLLSDANSGTDTGSLAPTALQLREYLTGGRFPKDNTTLPKMPMPVISIWFPNRAQEEVFQNARQFMENLANTEIGGGFYIVQGGEASRGKRIAKTVNQRFDEMYILKWRVACLAPTVTQDFQLVFKNTNPAIGGDECKACPLGQDPTQWPLDIDYEATEKHAKKNKIYPGGTVKIFGNFCWGTKHERAELYMVPKKQPLPASLKGKSPEEAKKARDTLIRSNMKGKAVDGGDNYIEFDLPDSTKWLVGKKKKFTARLIVYDSHAVRTSPVTDDKVLTLTAQEKPLNLLLIGGLAFGGVVVLLLLVGMIRGGGRRKRGRSKAAPRPVVAGGAPAPPGPAPPGAAAPAPQPGPQPGPQPAPAPAPGTAQAPGIGPPPGAAPMAANIAQTAPLPTQASLHGTPGIYPVAEGKELKVGRDPGICDVCLTEPRISGMHATVKFESGQLLIRDEGSNNGTFVNGGKIQEYMWVTVPPDGVLKFGPIEFTVRFE